MTDVTIGNRSAIFEKSTLHVVLAIAKAFAATLCRRCRTEDIIASQYEGRSWGDATEREMTNDIVNWGCARFRS
jgi:hypothetical protein